MTERIGIEPLTLNEIYDLFQKSLEIAFPKANQAIIDKLIELKLAKITSAKWVLTYEEFKGAKLNYYCDKIHCQPQPIVGIGMICRNTKGLILITFDASGGGIPAGSLTKNIGWHKWVRIYTDHFCERYAERIMRADTPTFLRGAEGIMFSDMLGPVRITKSIAEGIDEIEFQFKEGQAYGYRDSKSKITNLRTVYSNNMLRHDRLAFKNEWEQPLEELYELFKWK